MKIALIIIGAIAATALIGVAVLAAKISSLINSDNYWGIDEGDTE